MAPRKDPKKHGHGRHRKHEKPEGTDDGPAPEGGGSMHFSMEITGLCAIWRGELEANHEINALLLRGMDGTSHRPVITFDMRHFHSLVPADGEGKDGNGGGADSAGRIEVAQLPGGEQVGSWELEGKVVWIDQIPEAYPSGIKLLGAGSPSRPCPSDPTEEFAVRWIPSVGKACKNTSARVDPGFLTPNPGRSHNGNGHSHLEEVLARVDFRQGFLYSAARVNELRDPDVWKFMDGESLVMEQFVAETARLEIRELPAPFVKIHAHPYGKPDRVETLVLQSVDDAVRVALTNYPNILERKSEEFPHWMAYYSILESEPTCKSVPVRSTSRPRPDRPLGGDSASDSAEARGIRPVMCSPGLVP